MTFAEHGMPLLYAAFVWWFFTGVIVWLDGRPKHTFRWSFLLGGVAAAAGLAAILATLNDTSVAAAFIAFTGALAIWGWHEMSFLLGYVTGPRREACPPDARGWRRFSLATQTLIWHEIVLAATVLGLIAVAWDKANVIGAATFSALFALRLSSKLNIFFGVPNFTDVFLPPHLAYLRTYFAKRPAGAFFFASFGAGVGLAMWCAALAFAPAASPVEAAGFSLIFALVCLGLLEHLFMVAPINESALWRWTGVAARGDAAATIHSGQPAAAPAPSALSVARPIE